MNSIEIFENTENIIDFICKYKNKFEKRKYYKINEKYEIEKREPSFILELAYIFFETKNENIKNIVKDEFSRTYVEKEKRVDRMSKVDKTKLIDSFRRSITNQEKIHSVKLGNELFLRDREKFFEIMYNLALISMDSNRFIKIYFTEKIIDRVYEINGNNYNKNREIIDQIIKNVVNYFVKSENNYIDYNKKDDINYFLNNKVDQLYKEIYIKNYDKLKRKYNMENTQKFEILLEYGIDSLSESKKILYDYAVGGN